MRISLALVFVVALTFGGAGAAAQPTPRDEARAKNVEGARLMEEGRFTEALRTFQEGYAAFPSPKIQYNIALAYERLGRNADAILALERFLREADEVTADYRITARDKLQRLSSKVGYLHLFCDVEKAEVLLDGAKVGVTPLAGRLLVDPGRHALTIRAPAGGRSRTFTVTAGKTVELAMRLRPEDFRSTSSGEAARANTSPSTGSPPADTARLDGLSGPALAEALIRQAKELRKSGRDAAAFDLLRRAYEAETTPRTVAQLGLVEMQLGYMVQAERHLSEALASPRDPWIGSNRATLEQALVRVGAAIGEIAVSGTPAGAEVFVNGKPAGSLPLPHPLRSGEGPANVEIRAPGYISAIRSLNIIGGRRQEIVVPLEKTPGNSTVEQPPQAQNVAAVAAPRIDDQRTNQSTFALSRPLTWTSALGGIAALGLGVQQTISARHKNEQFENYAAPGSPTGSRDCGLQETNFGGEACAGLHLDFQRAVRLAMFGYIAGGLLTATSVALLVFTTPRQPASHSTVACALSPYPRGGLCRMTF